MIIRMYRVERPLAFFSVAGLLLAIASILLSLPLLFEYLATGLVPRLPTAVLSVGLMLSGQLAIFCGFILDTVTRGRHELRRMEYLSIPCSTMDEDHSVADLYTRPDVNQTGYFSEVNDYERPL